MQKQRAGRSTNTEKQTAATGSGGSTCAANCRTMQLQPRKRWAQQPLTSSSVKCTGTKSFTVMVNMLYRHHCDSNRATCPMWMCIVNRQTASANCPMYRLFLCPMFVLIFILSYTEWEMRKWARNIASDKSLIISFCDSDGFQSIDSNGFWQYIQKLRK